MLDVLGLGNAVEKADAAPGSDKECHRHDNADSESGVADLKLCCFGVAGKVGDLTFYEFVFA
jgi:hypothetical protein